jgi:hypothetical protein
MKTGASINSRHTAFGREANKSNQFRHSVAKQVAHRYERRKLREWLRHGVDSEEESSQFEKFG